MNKLYYILILSLLLTTTSFAGVKKGKGDVILDKYSLEKFIRYIRGKKSQYPIGFILSSDGSWSTYWFCPERDACGGMNYNPTIKECEDSTGVDCGLFARRYTILWKNGINPGKGKESRIKKKWSDEEIIAKLTELGFLDDGSTKNVSNDENLSKDVPNTLFFPDKEKIENWKEFASYGEGTEWPFAVWAEVRKNQSSDVYSYQWVARKTLNQAIKEATKGCNDRLKKRKSKFKNSQICIIHYINGLETTDEEKVKFAEKFYGKKVSKKSFEKNDWILNTKEKETKKVVKKYELKGERSIALSWDGYENLIAGTVEFDEADYKGTLKIPLPNNDGTCDGSYSLQEGGKGTWQIACTNNMGAAGTLKWTETGGVTGKGRDHNDKKVKFTVSKKS